MRSTRFVIGGVLGSTALFGVILELAPPGGALETAVANAGVVAVAVIASLLTTLAGFRAPGTTRKGWLILAAGLWTWAAAEAIWMVYIYAGLDPFPSVADVFYIGAAVPLLVGMLVLSAAPRTLARIRTSFDAVACTLAGGVLFWHYILLPAFSDSEATVTVRLVSAAYPALDIVLLFCGLMMLYRVAHGTSGAIAGLLAAGIGAFLAADGGFAIMQVGDSYTPGWVDAGWFGGYACFAGAAVLFAANAAQVERATGDREDERRLAAPAWLQALPLGVPAVAVPFLVVLGTKGELAADPVGVFTACAAIAAVIVREIIVLRDNVGLNHSLARFSDSLEAQVRERTKELSRLVSILDTTTDFVGTADPSGRLTYLNRAGRRMLGIDESKPLGKERLDHVHPRWAAEVVMGQAIPQAVRQGSWEGETAILDMHGTEVPVSQVLLAHTGDDGAVEFISTVARDITTQKEFERHLAHLANHDALTGLFNRHRLMEALDHEVARAGAGARFGLGYLDLDQFKLVNDTLGHGAGDDLLVSVSGLIRENLRPGDTLARLGGDEFAILIPDLDEAGVVARLEQTVAALRDHHIVVRGREVRVTASVGVAMAPEHGPTSSALLAHADMAMYRAKVGRNRVCVYSPDLDSEQVLEQSRLLEMDIRGALEHGRLTLFAQPIVSIGAERERHYEVLLRVVGEDGKPTLPPGFFAVAEQSDLIHEIDRWVVADAIRLAGEANRLGHPITLHVNVSARSFGDEGLIPRVRELLVRHGVEPHRMVFEVTETAAVTNMLEAREFIRSLKALGCRFALDDFGVGYSSIAHLKNLDVDFLKIDGAFVTNMARDDRDQHLVKAIVELAKALGQGTIAEFVEDAETLALLGTLGVDYAQGYHTGRPAPTSKPAAARERLAA